MRLLITNRNFALLWWGGLVSMIGNWTLWIALPIFVYGKTQSTLSTGLIVLAGTLPPIVFGSVAGVFVDRWRRQRILVVTNVLSFLVLLPIVVVTSGSEFWLVYLVAFGLSLLSQFFNPAETAFLPTLVPETRLASANALNALNNNLARLIGPALGGLVMARFGLQGVLVFDAATFFVAALLIAFIRVPEVRKQKTVPKPSEATSSISLWREWLEGLGLVRKNPVVALLFIMTAITAIGEGIMATLFVPFVNDILNGGSLEVGWLLSAQAVGGIVGGVIITNVATRLASHHLVSWGAFGVGVIDLVIFNHLLFIPGVTLGLVLFALVGLPVSGLQAGLPTLFQTSVVDRLRGRVWGAYGTTIALFNLVGVGAASLLGDRLGILPVINVQGVGYVVAGILGLLGLRRYLRATQSEAEKAARPSAK